MTLPFLSVRHPCNVYWHVTMPYKSSFYYYYLLRPKRGRYWHEISIPATPTVYSTGMAQGIWKYGTKQTSWNCYPKNFEYNAPLNIIRTPTSNFYDNVKICRPMYNTHPHISTQDKRSVWQFAAWFDVPVLCFIVSVATRDQHVICQQLTVHWAR